MARLVIRQLMPALFVLSAALLGYAYYRVWFRRQGHRIARIVLFVNSALVVLLWYDRVKLWLKM